MTASPDKIMDYCPKYCKSCREHLEGAEQILEACKQELDIPPVVPVYIENHSYIKRLNKNRNAIFTFLYHEEVPPDNNASERAVRNAKVNMKVSGQVKAIEGAQRFAILRSVIDTAIKNTQNVLNVLATLANLPPS